MSWKPHWEEALPGNLRMTRDSWGKMFVIWQYSCHPHQLLKCQLKSKVFLRISGANQPVFPFSHLKCLRWCVATCRQRWGSLSNTEKCIGKESYQFSISRWRRTGWPGLIGVIALTLWLMNAKLTDQCCFWSTAERTHTLSQRASQEGVRKELRPENTLLFSCWKRVRRFASSAGCASLIWSGVCVSAFQGMPCFLFTLQKVPHDTSHQNYS